VAKEDRPIEEQTDFIEDYKLLNKKFDEVKEDISVATFINQYLQGDKFEELRHSVRTYVEGYYAADVTKASILALKEEWQTSDDEQYRIEGGYKKLIGYLAFQCAERECQLFHSSAVKQIDWKENEVAVKTTDNCFTANKIIIIISLGVLQSNTIAFHLAIENKVEAARNLGLGSVIKLVLQFTDRFWEERSNNSNKNLDELGFVFSDQIVPTWWTQCPKKIAVLKGWLGVPHALALKDLSEEEVLQKASSSLSHIFNIDIVNLQQKLRSYKVFN